MSASTETRADRIRRRIADHRLGALLVVSIGLIGTVGGAIGGARQIAGLFDGSADTKTTTVSLNPSELKLARNERYGFSFQYPTTWQRADPANSDGVRAIGAEPGLELVAYGRLPTAGPSPTDVFERLDYQVRQLTDASGSRLVEATNQQNLTRVLPGGETTDVAGMRFVMETDGSEEVPEVTTVGLATTTPERDVELLCQVPTRLYSAWRGACNQFLSTLTLTR